MRGYPTIYNNIIFIECDTSNFRPVIPVKVDLSFKLGAQLKTLNDVKEYLAYQAIQSGCNCIINFTYGQKSRWLAIDDVAYFGEGLAGIIDPVQYNEICQYIAAR